MMRIWQCGSSAVRRHPELFVFTIYLIFILSLETLFRPHAIGGFYFQLWTSEDMMQTMPLVDLRDQPLTSLANLHIQPPALDALRALSAWRWRLEDGQTLLRSVDRDLYHMWAVLFALMGLLVYRWLAQLTSARWALVASLIFMIHPAAILYASFLESTFLFSLGILWSYYELWKLYKQPHDRSVLPLSASFLLIFFTRSIIQWPALFVYTAALLLMKIPLRKVVLFTGICGGIVALYTVRQLLLFDMPYTSSLVGGNCYHGLGDFSTYAGYGVEHMALDPPRSPAGVLNRELKLTGALNYNHYKYLQFHRAMLGNCYRRMLNQPLTETIRAFLGNFLIYLQPSSQFTTPHVITDRLPWRGIYNTVFSNLVLLFWLAICLITWIKTNPRQDYVRGLGMLLPAACIFLVTVLFERGENMRYKFFLEPVFYIFLVSQIFSLSQYFLLNSKRPSWSTTVS